MNTVDLFVFKPQVLSMIKLYVPVDSVVIS